MEPNQPTGGEEDISPPLPATAPATLPGPGRWWAHLLILTSYPLIMGILGAALQSEAAGPALGTNLPILIVSIVSELIFFGIFFGLAWSASRINAHQLFMRGGSGTGMLWRGLLYSVGLRMLIMGFILGLAVVTKMTGGSEESLANLRPNIESLVDPSSLVGNPLFLLLNMTVISFILGGLREELWRAGMLAGFMVLFPRLQASWKGKLLGVTIIAVLFGMGHLPQGWGGVVMTTIIGWGLGVVMIWRKSLWEAALAHGFFNATTFLLLYLLAKFQPQALETL